MSRQDYHNTNGYITVNGRAYVAKLRFARRAGAGHKWNVERAGFERNKAGEILYALPGTDETATERELRRGNAL